MSFKYFGSKSWLKKRFREILPLDTRVLISPFFGSGKIEYDIAAQRPSLKVQGSDTFTPVIYTHRCFLKIGGKLLRYLNRFVNKTINKPMYFKLLEMVSNPRSGDSVCKLAAYFYVIMNFSYNGKYGSYAASPPLNQHTVDKLKLHR